MKAKIGSLATAVAAFALIGPPSTMSTNSAQAQAPGTPPPAQGSAKYSKKEIEVQGVPQTDLTKPKLPPKDQKPSGPTLTVEELVGRRQDKIQKLNQVTIEKYQRLLRVIDDDDPQKADFHFRIAELYAEQQ